ncbi:MAG: DNA methyltransferase [Cyanobacteria bacterium P01_F01_bin.56]
MPVDRKWVRTYLQQFDFESLFIEELGWDMAEQPLIPVGIDDEPYQAQTIAQKRGMFVYHCQPENGGSIPNNGARRKIEKQINQYTREHLIIYSDAEQQNQIWQWVRREKGKPLAVREYSYHITQDGESLVQKLEALEIDFEEEDNLTLTEVTKRTKKAFDVDKVTKKFYNRFEKEHQRFLDFITGIQELFDKEKYSSIMFNRLMFVYFMQKKKFLDDDRDYLRNRLSRCQQEHGDVEFYSFYRYFLLRLFHEGLGSPVRDDPTLESLIGKIPYMNGGLFDVHELEERYPDIQIPDEAFKAIFDFFDDFHWHLDDRPLRNDKEINPDVLGYIFEKYINQKQIGAYYTKEDITEYISKNTIIPYLFDAAKRECAIAFEPNGEVWRLLRDNPNRYIYDAVQKGVDLELPEEIAVGIEDVSKRDIWNRFAEPDYALPTELWREHVARRQRCLEIREKLSKGEIHDINNLITYNLNIHQFAQDVVDKCEGPELLRGFYKAISQISVLDPTCGSGAFLFAALKILEPLYKACLDRMQGFVDDLEHSTEKPHPEKFRDFRQTLEHAAKHPNRGYFILKSIILGNLYGVDIMEEAVEICKLRLFLKLVSQVDAKPEKPNYGLEPLPDIDFNIRAGNTLVGFANYDEVKKAVEGDEQRKIDLFSDTQRIDESAEVADRAFQMFRKQQTELDMDASRFKTAKAEVKRRLEELNNELNRYLADQYKLGLSEKDKSLEKWRRSHQPFHWFVEFHRIIRNGGFDVVIGNPPYVELIKIKKQYRCIEYRTERCGNLYALCSEKSYELMAETSRFGFIVQQPVVSTQRMSAIRQIFLKDSSFIAFSTYDDRPSKLFDGIHHARTAIILSKKGKLDDSNLYVSSYQKWYKQERQHLFHNIGYTALPSNLNLDYVPKINSDIELSITRKLIKNLSQLSNLISSSSEHNKIYYKITGVGHWFTITNRPPRFYREGVESSSTREKSINFDSKRKRDYVLCILNSSLFYWFYQVRTNCRDFNPSDYKSFPWGRFPIDDDCSRFADMLQEKLDQSSILVNLNHSKTGAIELEQFKPREAKEVIDSIDAYIANQYELDSDELDFIRNYDVKYRMGLDYFDGEYV